ncbi:MAG: PIG-L deacetylase family protein [Planctomycetota bacterium]
MPIFLDPPANPRPVAGPPASGPVLVFAPHPDDETIGAGGTLCLHHRRGDHIKAIFLTAGTAGDVEGRYSHEQYRDLREAEARAAAKVLGIAEVEFWRFPDGARAREEDMDVVLPRVRQAIADYSPGVIYYPNEQETHSDHFVTALAVHRAMRELKSPARLLAYEIWTVFKPDIVVDISDVFARKIEAARAYPSQLKFTDFVRAVEGLDAYRSIFLPKGSRYGEAFREGHC